jgi:arylsulfatase A-like enzyme
MSSQDSKPNSDSRILNRRNMLLAGTTLAAASALGSAVETAVAQAQQAAPGAKPNILVIMGDDVGWFNIGAYHQGIMSGKTPNLDKLAADGMRFTDYYAEASCTAGRANFITGEIPLRTGLTTVGQAGADVGIPDEACTLATALKSLGYATGQFGKNHLGDLNKYLPTSTASTSSSAIYITSTRCPIHTGTRSRSTRISTISTARAASCIATRPTPTTRQ